MKFREDTRRDNARGGDKSDPAYWRAAAEGDWVSLSDSQAFEAALARPGAGAALDYRVGQVRSFAILGRERPEALRAGPRGRRGASVAASGLPIVGEYRFIELAREGEGSVYLAAITSQAPGSEPAAHAGEALELRAYFIPEGIGCGDRDELIDRGETWLFLPPPDPEDFISSELEYAPYPDLPEIEESDGATGEKRGRKLVFSPAGTGKPLYGEAGDSRAPVLIAEWEAETPEGEEAPANPLLLALEEGWMKPDGSVPDEGGYITVMLGKRIALEEVELWRA